MSIVSNHMVLKYIKNKYKYKIPFEFTMKKEEVIEAKCVYVKYHEYGEHYDFPARMYIAFDKKGKEAEVVLISEYPFEPWEVEKFHEYNCSVQGFKELNEVHYLWNTESSVEKITRIVDVFYSCCEWAYRKLEQQRLIESHNAAKEFLNKTRQLLPKKDLINELAIKILEQSKERLFKIKGNCLSEQKALSYGEFRKQYFSSDRILDLELKTKEEEERMDTLILRWYLIGDPVMEEVFSTRFEGISAGRVLYMLYFTKESFTSLQYRKCRFLDSIERIILKKTYHYICNQSLGQNAFNNKLEDIFQRFEDGIMKKG